MYHTGMEDRLIAYDLGSGASPIHQWHRLMAFWAFDIDQIIKEPNAVVIWQKIELGGTCWTECHKMG